MARVSSCGFSSKTILVLKSERSHREEMIMSAAPTTNVALPGPLAYAEVALERERA